MNPYITISELAKLMHVSVHQIRYFEEKGLLPPAFTGDNQYRMYSMDEVYRLAHILLLRQLDVAVPQVKQCLEDYTATDYQKLLRQSTEKLEQQIAELQALQQRIGRIQAQQQQAEAHHSHPFITELATRSLTIWTTLPADTTWTARQLQESSRMPTAPAHLFEQDLVYVYAQQQDHTSPANELIIGYEVAQGAEGVEMELRSGKYMCQFVFITQEDELDGAIAEFAGWLEEKELTCSGPLIFIERSYLSMFYNKQLCYELQQRIAPEPAPYNRSSL